MIKLSRLLAFLGLVGVGLPTASNATLIQNGSFETGVNPPTSGYQAIFAGNSDANDITGWVVSAGRIDWISASYRTPKDLSRSVELDGVGGAISQTFATSPGHSYKVNFSLLYGFGTDYGTGNNVDKVDVSLGGSTFHEVMSQLGGRWYDFSETLLATSASSTLTFTCVGLSDFYNSPFLDAVTVTDVTPVAPVPEPSTYIAGTLMLLPFGVRFIRALRRK